MEIKKLFIVQGTRRQRWMMYFLTFLLAYLVHAATSALLSDFTVIPQPNVEQYNKKYLSKETTEQVDKLGEQLTQVNEQLNQAIARRQRLQENAATLKKTIDLLTAQTLANKQSGAQLSPDEVNAKATSLNLFLENQKQDQELGQSIITLTNQQQLVNEQHENAKKALEKQRLPATEEYDKAMEHYRFKVAMMQSGAICLLLIIATLFLLKSQQSKLKLIAIGVFLGIFLQALDTFYLYFPLFYFKYLVMAFLIGLTIHGLRSAIHFAQSNQVEVLLKRYRDAYTCFLCPMCEFPIRRGPMTFAYWTRRSLVNCRIESQHSAADDEPYTCPVCSTNLFKKCKKCQKTRYGLLPACQHCGDQEALPS